jgi:hypothetical protein
MARLPEGKQHLAFGYYYTMEPGKKFPDVKVRLSIKWYAWPFLMWQRAHEMYEFKWHHYPWLLYLIGKHTVLKWMER